MTARAYTEQQTSTPAAVEREPRSEHPAEVGTERAAHKARFRASLAWALDEHAGLLERLAK